MTVEIGTISGDGSSKELSEEMLAIFKAELTTISDSLYNVSESRLEAEESRFCIWPGQSTDGRKWDRNKGEGEEGIFDGETDSRCRTVDLLVNENKMLKVLAATRSIVRARPMGKDDSQKAARVEALLKYLITNVWGSDFFVEISRLADYVEGDEPGAALLGIYWRREYRVRYEELTANSLVEKYIAMVKEEFADNPDALTQRMEQILQWETAIRESTEDEARKEEAVEWLMLFYPYLSKSTAGRTIDSLRKTGKARFPVRYISRDEPKICAHRLFQDAFLPATVRRFQDAPFYFITEDLTKSQLEARIVTENYSREWVERVVGSTANGTAAGQMGIFNLPRYVRSRTWEIVKNEDIHYCQIVHAYFTANNQDGIPGCYSATFHANLDGSAYGKKLADYPHGGYPGVVFVRGVISQRLLDARGVSSLAGSSQALQKLAYDTTGNIAQFSLPPIISIGRKTAGGSRLKPLEENRLSRNGELKFMAPPSAGSSYQLDQWIGKVDSSIDQYWGRAGKNTDPASAAVHQEYAMALWLSQLRDFFQIVVKYCQKWLPPETMQKIVDANGDVLIESLDDIAGNFDVELTFEPRDFDMKHLEMKVKMYAEILNTLDSSASVERSQVVSRLMYAIDGGVAAASVLDVTRADVKEKNDEELNFLKISAGLPVEMREDGQNFPMRLQVLSEILQRDPNVVALLPPERQQSLMDRMKHLQFQTDQKGVNAQAGRTGVMQKQPGPEQQAPDPGQAPAY